MNNVVPEPRASSPGSASLAGPDPLLAVPVPGVTPSDLSQCLVALLAVLGWKGGSDDLLGALPHAEASLDVTDIRNTLAHLGYGTRPERLRRGRLDPRRLPALLLAPGKAAAVLYRGEDGTVLRFDGATSETAPCAPGNLSGRLLFVQPLPPPAAPAVRGNWFATLARRFLPEVPALFGISALVTVLGLGVPLFSMAVFDVVVAGHSQVTLVPLATGALLALVAEIGFRALRQRALARIGQRLDRLVSTGVFSQLMALPAALVERAGTAAQVSRLRDFAALREFLTGAFAVAVLDLPFSLLVLGLLVLLGGWVALVPVLTLAAFAVLFLATRGAVRRAVAAAAVTSQAREALALEVLEAQRTLKLAGAEERWTERYAAAAAAAAHASAHAAAVSGNVLQASQSLVTLSGLAALLVGVLAVLGHAMTPGALIAGMMLIWRVLGPMQTGFVMLTRWEQTRSSMRQVDGMMTLEVERPPPGQARMAPPERGDIVFQRVSLRYLAQAEPVLAGVSFAIRHGDLVAITGADGSGKSSLLKLVSGLYRPQAGVVRIDGHDIRAFDPAVLRRAVAWVPQTPELLYGTIAQNLRLARPSADDAMLREAAAAAHVLDAIEALPHGFDTRVGDNATARLPRSIQRRIALARALLREAPILLLDEPVAGLDDECAAAFTEIIATRRGGTTILMATHRPSHIRLADRVLTLRDGQVEMSSPAPAPPAAPLTRLPVFPNAGGRS